MSFYLRRALLTISKSPVITPCVNGQIFQQRLLASSSKDLSFKPKSVGMTKGKKFLAVVGVGIGIGTIGVGYYSMFGKKKEEHILSTNDYLLAEHPPEFTPSRSILNKDDNSGLKLTLYQYQTCPFCCKVRAFLDYYGYSYDVVEVNSITRKQTKWTAYKKVPFLLVKVNNSDKVFQLKDSSMIISALYSTMVNKECSFEEILKYFPIKTFTDVDGNEKSDINNKYFIMYGDEPIIPTTEKVSIERNWRKWVDDVYVHTLSPNIYRTPSEAYDAFTWFSEVGNWKEHFKTWERLLVVYLGSSVMYLIGKKLKKKHGLKDDVRVSLYDETNKWVKGIKTDGSDFMGGASPNLADLNVYGMLTAIEGCDTYQDLIENTKIHRWFDNMKEAVKRSDGSQFIAAKGLVT